MDLFTLVARLSMDTSEYDSKIGKAKGSFTQLGNTISAKAVAFGQLTARAIEKAASAAVKLGQSTIEAAAAIEAERAQFTATFGEMQGAAEKTFASIEKSTGVFGTRLKNVGTKAFSQFKGAGLDGVDALSMMEQYTNLAADAAAYYDITLEDADTRLRSFLRGNTEAGDAIGLFTSEAQRNTYAMEKYNAKWTELTEAQKQMLMLDVASDIYKQSGAIGQAARESDAWTNVMSNLQEVWRQTSAKLGAPIMAVITPKIQELSEWLQSESVQTWMTRFGLTVANAINWVLSPTLPTWEEFKAGAQEKFDAINEGLKTAINWALGKLQMPDVDTIISDVSAWWTGQGNNAYERIKTILTWSFGKWVAPAASEYTDDVTSWWNDTFKPSLTSIVQWTFGELIVPSWVDLMMTVYNWWNYTIRPAVKAITTWDFGKVQFPAPGEVITAAQTWWDSIKGAVSSIFKVVISPEYKMTYPNATVTQEDIDIISGPSYKIPGFATGLDYVPRNNYLARLHEGEAVLTKSEANAWRSSGGVQVTGGASVSEIASAVASALNGAFVDLDGERVGQLILPTVSRGMAQGVRSRRYST